MRTLARLFEVASVVLAGLWLMAGCEAYSRWSDYRHGEPGWIIIWVAVTFYGIGISLRYVDWGSDAGSDGIVD